MHDKEGNPNLHIEISHQWETQYTSEKENDSLNLIVSENFILDEIEPRICQTSGDFEEYMERWNDDFVFTSLYKRERYRNHKDNLDNLEFIFCLISKELPRRTSKIISSTTGIPKSTISTWRKKLRINPQWRPKRTNYGRHTRIFTEEEEIALMGQIREQFLSKDLFYSDKDFQYDCIAFYNKLINDKIEKIKKKELPPQRFKNFKCSPHFIIDFRKRWNHSLRRPNLKRRPSASKEQIEKFKEHVRCMIQKYGRSKVINMDETHFKVVNNGFLTWALKGAETINCYIGNDPKDGVTVLATIDANGIKWPLMIVGKGKTKRCLKGYELGDDVWTSYSDSGWTKENVVLEYMKKIKERINGPCCLIMDTYKAHLTQAVREKAKELEIELLFVPPGCTDSAQPLDIKVFGVLKSYARMLWRKYHHIHPEERISHAILAKQIIEAWKMVGHNVIKSAWSSMELESFLDEEEEENTLDDEEFQLYFEG